MLEVIRSGWESPAAASRVWSGKAGCPQDFTKKELHKTSGVPCMSLLSLTITFPERVSSESPPISMYRIVDPRYCFRYSQQRRLCMMTNIYSAREKESFVKLGLLDSGSLVGNESAIVLSSIFSRTCSLPSKSELKLCSHPATRSPSFRLVIRQPAVQTKSPYRRLFPSSSEVPSFVPSEFRTLCKEKSPIVMGLFISEVAGCCEYFIW